MSDAKSAKREALISAGKIGHRVLLFGEKVHGELELYEHQNATIDVHPFPKLYESLERLANYSLVILDYGAFDITGYNFTEHQKFFEKQMLDALDTGTIFCFVHYNQPSPQYSNYKDVTQAQIQQLSKTQIGFKWLVPLSAKAHIHDDVISDTQVQRNEFRPFLDRWGASHNVFESGYDIEFDDVIGSVGELTSAFAYNLRRGKLIYMPFQRDFARKEHTSEGLNSLIDSLLTYITKSISEVPEWGKAPFFDEEVKISKQIKELEERLTTTRTEINPFQEAKGLLFQSEYTLESSLPRFISSHLGIQTFRDEKHKEDFWILGEDHENAVIVEVKSFVKGFKKGAIFNFRSYAVEIRE